jgi:2-hydroxychromene-2-carboxylate isomerase
MADVECFFDCSSPWTYFAFHSLLEMQKELGLSIAWRPHLVGGVFNAVNPSVHNSREKPVIPKQAYGKKDQMDWARYLGLRMHYRPTVFPVNSVKVMRGCIWLENTDKLVPFALATFEAYWGDDKDISQIPVLTEICEKSGVDPKDFLAAIEQQPIKDKLRATTQELIDRGGFGSPTIFVGGDDMYFGNDRMPLIRDAVLRRRGDTPRAA